MHYRVRKFNGANSTMEILEEAHDLNDLNPDEEIVDIENCGAIRVHQFKNASLVKSQRIRCISNGGAQQNSTIIRE